MNQPARSPQPVRPGVAPRPAQAPVAERAAPAPRPTNQPRPVTETRPAPAADAPARPDAENRRLLDAALPRYEKLRSEQMRARGDVERAQEELAAAEKAALEALGTCDVAEIEKQLLESRQANTEVVDEFVALVNKLEADLGALASA